jgi:hypothetical protein
VARFPGKEILVVSPRKGIGLERWFTKIAGEEQTAEAAMEVDYQVYADGEASLGWLNCMAQLAAAEAFDGNSFLRELAGHMQQRLGAAKAEVAHLKMTLSPDSGKWDIGVVNLVRNDFLPEISVELKQPVRDGRLTINLRAEAAPRDSWGGGARCAGGSGQEVRDAEGDNGAPGTVPSGQADADAPVREGCGMTRVPGWFTGEFFGTFLRCCCCDNASNLAPRAANDGEF